MSILQKTPKRNLVLWKYNLESEEKEAMIFIIPEEERNRLAAKGQANHNDIVDGEVITLNQTATRIWEFCDGTYTVEEMVEIMCRDYQINTDTALQDIGVCLDFFTEKGLVNVEWTSF